MEKDVASKFKTITDLLQMKMDGTPTNLAEQMEQNGSTNTKDYLKELNSEPPTATTDGLTHNAKLVLI